jgi:carboxylesterase type B
VIFYIHGGGFVRGDGQTEDFTYFLEDGLVVVTINYRLGSLGKHFSLHSIFRGEFA